MKKDCFKCNHQKVCIYLIQIREIANQLPGASIGTTRKITKSVASVCNKFDEDLDTTSVDSLLNDCKQIITQARQTPPARKENNE